MTKTVIMHLSSNCYPALPANHHTKNIWQQLSIGVDEYHVVARSLNNTYSFSQEGNIYLHLFPKVGRSAFYFMFISLVILYLIPKYKVTHVVAQSPVVGGFTVALMKYFYKFRFFVEIHGELYFGANQKGVWIFNFYKTLTKFSFSKANCIRVLSKSMLDDLERVYGKANRDKSVVIPVRVDKNVFNDVKLDYNLTKKNSFNMINIGAFNSVKNHLALLENLSKINLPITLTIIGNGGSLKEACLIRAKELGINLILKENISQKEIGSLLAQNDIYIHYSVAEGTPRAIIEAMLVGLPVVAVDVGYIKDIIESNVNGLLLSTFTDAELEIALSKLIDIDLRRNLGERARQYVFDNFEASVVFPKYRRFILGE